MKIDIARRFLLLLAILASGCGSLQTTPDSLMRSPDSTASFHTALPFDAAYRQTLSMVKACYEAGGHLNTSQSVYGDKGDNDAIVAVQLNSAFGNRIMATFRLVPVRGGTDVTIYIGTPFPMRNIEHQLRRWLNEGSGDC